MGGIGSGNRLQWASNVSLNGILCIDVRHFARDGLLRDGCQFGLQWSRHGEECGDIQVEAHSHSISLKYRSRRGSDEWSDMTIASNFKQHHATLAATAFGFYAQRKGVGGALPSSMGAAFSRVGLVTKSATRPKKKTMVTEHPDVRRKSKKDWAGPLAF